MTKSQEPGTWERVKTALKADWEQTKSDFGSDKARDLHQGISDTFKQMVGNQPLPNFEEKEDAFRYGATARQQHGSEWDERVESDLQRTYPGDYESDRPYIYYGYSHSKTRKR